MSLAALSWFFEAQDLVWLRASVLLLALSNESLRVEALFARGFHSKETHSEFGGLLDLA